MSPRRRNYTHREAQEVLTDWLRRNRMTPSKFKTWLDERGVAVTAQYCGMLTRGALTPGPKFKAIFKQITGITLVDGLIEDRGRHGAHAKGATHAAPRSRS